MYAKEPAPIEETTSRVWLGGINGMLTPLKLALSAAAALTGGYALNGAFDDAGTQLPANSTPVDFQWTLASQDTTQQVDAKLDRKVSISINGTVSDVAKWLTDQNISYVISDQNLTQKKLMINMVDQPLRDVVGAIADALGGRWQKRGDVYVFQSAGPVCLWRWRHVRSEGASHRWRYEVLHAPG
jgi:hypothetical protein